VGKTAVALSIAESLGREIVSVDSRQIYRELDIGTAKPTREESARVQHHLLDLVQPWEAYSCGQYRVDATNAIKEILGRGKTPILVGGSGLYLRALEKGIFEGPQRNDALRSELRRIVEREGRESLHRRLAEIDPISSLRIHPRDTERVVRAIEVFEITGKSISELQKKSTRPGQFDLKLIGLRRQRETLYRLINERFEKMLLQGLIEEIEGLISKGFSESWPSFRTVGYREMVQYFRGDVGLEAAKEKAKMQTRRFAKRQMTWLNRSAEVTWIDVEADEEPDRTAKRVLEVLKSLD